MNKKIIYTILIISFIFFLILSIVFNSKSRNAREDSIKNLNVFSNITDSKESYFYVEYLGELNGGYAIAFNNSTPHVVYLDDKFDPDDYSFESHKTKFVGTSKQITDEVKDRILEIYNKDSKAGTEDYLNKEDFESVFGTYYMVVKSIEVDIELHKMPSFLSGLFLDLSLISLLILGFKIVLDKRK